MSEQTDDRALWRRFVEASESLAEPSALELAAYAEGTLSEAGQDQVEAWLAVNPDGWDAILSARAVRDIEPDELPVPLASVRRARALVAAPLAVNPWQKRAGWIAVAASLLLICIAELPGPARHAPKSALRAEPVLLDLGVNVGVGAGDAGSLL